MIIPRMLRRTLWPEEPDPSQPSAKRLSKALVSEISCDSKLALQSLRAEQGNMGGTRACQHPEAAVVGRSELTLG